MTDTDIARLLDRRVEPGRRDEMLDHLRDCEACFELYRDSAITYGLRSTNASSFETAADLLDIAKGVSREESSTLAARTGAGSRRTLVVGIAAAAAVVLAAGVLWFASGDRRGPDALDRSLVAPLRVAAETASSWGPFVLPGGEAFAPSDDPPLRSGFVPADHAFKDAMKTLLDRYETDSSIEAARWLASGYLATGQIDLARDITRDALTLYPDDPALESVAGLVVYVDGDSDDALERLESAHTASPHDPAIAINFAKVLAEAGRSADARRVLDGIDPTRLTTGLAARVEKLRKDL